jgi:hypothetical protein
MSESGPLSLDDDSKHKRTSKQTTNSRQANNSVQANKTGKQQ